MRLSLVIAALRLRCPTFNGRVAGAAEYGLLTENSKMALPSAWVIPTNDTVGEQRSQTDYWQIVTDGFAVVVVMDNSADQRGQKAAFDAVHDLRAELFKALLGWQPEPCYDAIQYDGGNLLDTNRAHLYYQYDFSAKMEINEED
ncbi:phage tail terminator protein, partial [Yersinia aldovae]